MRESPSLASGSYTLASDVRIQNPKAPRLEMALSVCFAILADERVLARIRRLIMEARVLLIPTALA